jgi:hypothetical protein
MWSSNAGQFWALVFAILIDLLGLNVNSSAVISARCDLTADGSIVGAIAWAPMIFAVESCLRNLAVATWGRLSRPQYIFQSPAGNRPVGDY